jgi:alpha-amylase
MIRKPTLVRLSLALVIVLSTFMAQSSLPSKVRTAHAADPFPARTVFVHLFEWKWTDIANECETFLGPKGYTAVQVSPPMEHAVIASAGYPWWQRYQPVSYQIQSRSGTRAQFANMVSRCKAVGVDIYVDAVINHMTGVGSGTGSAGSTYTAYNYPGNYQTQDFHHCGRNGTDDIVNYQDRWEVQNCELVNLADLNTGSEYVRNKLAAYMNDLLSLGVAGFRIDAAKHMDTNDVNAIVSRLNNTIYGTRPYVYQEVIDQGGEPITAGEYFQNGDVIEFKYSIKIGDTFKNGQLSWLSNFGTPWGFMASDNAIVFTDNHDNQRGHGGAGGVLTFKDGSLYTLGNVFELAWPYGYPQVMSSYNFTNSDQGPPSDANGNTLNVSCFNGQWICEHRWREIANMVAFRDYTNSYFGVTNWWSNGNNQIAFGRGGKGFVVINRESTALNVTFQTGMAAGTYCDIIAGDFNNGTCTGRTITVDGAGNATISVGAMYAAAIHIGAKLALQN